MGRGMDGQTDTGRKEWDRQTEKERNRWTDGEVTGQTDGQTDT